MDTPGGLVKPLHSAIPAISRVAFLLGIQGAGELFMGVAGALTLPLNFFYAARAGHAPSNLQAAVLIGWHMLAAVAGC